ncbi:pyridoxal phosphate-dependent transferase [Piptocephalis cylindrospora]|uniref:Pyridoxal phosphate-dependent transferase n=1 Tax=Piptocephalis cylindrospora TaxID=1907219 RepID=A0A4P9Y6T0_9FUNG|nr:pyridoxal phosphate-dependent transferase [Piptocephalis cylindrospora]|eukprot:RKP14745.1 pyridoxal phosphate-dependent transferase [Piptocephalis cylindrospora]
MSSTTLKAPIAPAERVAHFKQDVWSLFTRLTLEHKAVNLGQGFMNFPPPRLIKDAASAAIHTDSFNQYPPPRGRPRLLKALSDHYSPVFGRTLDPTTDIFIPSGANEGIYCIFAAYLNQGDEVILFEPYFDQYLSNVTMNGGVPVFLPLIPGSSQEDGVIPSSSWKVDMNELEKAITPKTKIILLNTPHNPVGKVFSEEEIRAIGDLAVKHNILILSDEVYDHLVFSPSKHLSIGALPEYRSRTLTVGSAGKVFGVTGWRLGWVMGDAPLLAPVLAAHTRVCFCATGPLQEAVAEAFEKSDSNGFFDQQTKEYESRLAALTKPLEEVGLPYTLPKGSYFLLVNTSSIRIPQGFSFPPEISARGRNFEMCYWLLAEIGVTAIPVSEFYSDTNQHLGEDYIRFAFCKTDDVLEEASKRLLRIKEFL